MSEKRKVVTKNGKLYRVGEVSGRHYVMHYAKISILPGMDTTRDLGSARNLEDALTLIKSHAGSDIKKIEAW